MRKYLSLAMVDQMIGEGRNLQFREIPFHGFRSASDMLLSSMLLAIGLQLANVVEVRAELQETDLRCLQHWKQVVDILRAS